MNNEPNNPDLKDELLTLKAMHYTGLARLKAVEDTLCQALSQLSSDPQARQSACDRIEDSTKVFLDLQLRAIELSDPALAAKILALWDQQMNRRDQA